MVAGPSMSAFVRRQLLTGRIVLLQTIIIRHNNGLRTEGYSRYFKNTPVGQSISSKTVFLQLLISDRCFRMKYRLV
jgi:hypothetical protein